MTEQNETPVSPRLSATVMLLRDQPDGLEVFMVVRHRQIEFASGAIVFPGARAYIRGPLIAFLNLLFPSV